MNKRNLTKKLVDNVVNGNTVNQAAQAVKEERIARTEASFDLPAVTVNNFQLALTPSYLRMAAGEASGSGVIHTRVALAIDFETLPKLYKMIGETLKYMQDQLLAQAAAGAEEIQDPTKAVDDNEKAANDTQAKVG